MLLLVLCLFFPVLLVGSLLAQPRQAVPETGWERLLAWPPERLLERLIVAELIVLTCISCFYTVKAESSFLFEDSFISYRYAQNFADGYGLVWNPNEIPSEGFTNLLLVLVVGASIALGGDPLLTARVLGVLATLLIAYLVYRAARREVGATPIVAFILALGSLVGSVYLEAAMLGLETVMFAAAILAAYDLAQQFTKTDQDKWLLASGLVVFLAFTLRPEAVFLPVAIVGATVLLSHKNLAHCWRVARLLALGAGVPIALLLAWKLYYFGSLIPNPALVKMPGNHLVSEGGLHAILLFVRDQEKVILAAFVGVAMASPRNQNVVVCALFTTIYLLFYLHVDTLMNFHHRFLLPIFAFLYLLALPFLERLIRNFLEWRQLPALKVLVAPALFLLLFFFDAGLSLARVSGRAGEAFVATRHLQHSAVFLAKAGRELAKYPAIREVTIGSSDAGLLPYLTRARHVDPVGLTTRFTAENRDVTRGADYYFGQRPDLIVLRTNFDGTLQTGDHGVLGDTTKWAHHPGWNAYEHVGGLGYGAGTSIHFFVRKDSVHRSGLTKILKERVISENEPDIQVHLGTR